MVAGGMVPCAIWDIQFVAVSLPSWKNNLRIAQDKLVLILFHLISLHTTSSEVMIIKHLFFFMCVSVASLLDCVKYHQMTPHWLCSNIEISDIKLKETPPNLV